MNSLVNGDVAADANGNACVRTRSASRQRLRGASSRQLLLGVLLIAVAALAAWWFLGQRGVVRSILPATPKVAVAVPGTPEAAAPVPPAELSVNQLFKEARTAMGDKRVASPPGNNALEYYIGILDKQPGDADATDALRELFPFATDTVQDDINSGSYDEANRIIGLLAKADPSNYTLTILRSKLDAKKKLDDRDQQQVAQRAAAASATQRPAPSTAATDGTSATSTQPSPGTPPEAAAPAAPKAAIPQVVRATPAPSAAPPPVPVAPAGETRDVRVVTPPRPEYPPAAARNRQDGSVEVEFTVAADGSVQNAKVVNSSGRVFDNAALSAIKGAKFEARLENGKPTASTLRRRIDFKLGQ